MVGAAWRASFHSRKKNLPPQFSRAGEPSPGSRNAIISGG
jgi:hypothetical protein